MVKNEQGKEEVDWERQRMGLSSQRVYRWWGIGEIGGTLFVKRLKSWCPNDGLYEGIGEGSI